MTVPDTGKATEAGAKLPKRSPYEKSDRNGPIYYLWALAGYATQFYAGSQVHGWLRWSLWSFATVSLLIVLVFYPLGKKVLRRKNLMARQQVWTVKKLCNDGPGRIGADHFFEVSPESDPLSFYHGVSFALARVHRLFDEVERDTPKSSWLGVTIEDDGTATRKRG